MDAKNFVAVVPVWSQTSSDYAAERDLATKIVSPSTTVQELMEWRRDLGGLHVGDLTLTVPAPPGLIEKEA